MDRDLCFKKSVNLWRFTMFFRAIYTNLAAAFRHAEPLQK
ncbi:MAG: hypothetical protein JWO44_1166 [Bacteroidetes bacterium]|nr:hypothetical protein [Bacteroidota bacterium]